MKSRVLSIPLLGPLIRRTASVMLPRKAGFTTSPSYWESRYQQGGNSGAGSHGRLAQFKAETLNAFVAEQGVGGVLELGCGDGAQLALARYPRYTGIDVSPTAVELCRRKFAADPHKEFFQLQDAIDAGLSADLALSLDVIYHVVEDANFDIYMRTLAAMARRFIGIYSSNHDAPGPSAHVRHRKFSDWMAQNSPEWKPQRVVRNPYPYDASSPDETTWADFHFYCR